MLPCCCFYESSLLPLLYNFSRIFLKVTWPMTQLLQTNTGETLMIPMFGLSGSLLHRAVQRRQRGGGVHVGVSLSGGETSSGTRLMPRRAGIKPGRRPRGSSWTLSVCSAPNTGSEITRCWNLYTSNSSIWFGSFVVWNQEPTIPADNLIQIIWSRLSASSKVHRASGLSRTVMVLVCAFSHCRNVDYHLPSENVLQIKSEVAVWSNHSQDYGQKVSI